MGYDKDLYISIRAASHPNHVYNGGPENATFPGWFVDAYSNEGYDRIIPVTQLTSGEVTAIVDVIDRLVDKTSNSHWRVTHAVQRATLQMQADLKRQLEQAERSAARIPELRKRLGLDQ